MNIFLGGAHRTGKTTIATKLASRLGRCYRPTHLSSMKMWAKIGNPSDYYTFAERVRIQEELFDYFVNVIDSVQLTDNIFDRSIFDLVGYLNTNFDSTCSALFDEFICDFFIPRMNKFMALDEYTTKTYILQPNASYKYCLNDVVKNNKVYNSYAYRQALTDSIVGYAVRNLKPHQYEVIPVGLNSDEVVDYIVQKTIYKLT